MFLVAHSDAEIHGLPVSETRKSTGRQFVELSLHIAKDMKWNSPGNVFRLDTLKTLEIRCSHRVPERSPDEPVEHRFSTRYPLTAS